RKPRVAGSGSATRTAFGIAERRYSPAARPARCPLQRLCAEPATTIASRLSIAFPALPYAPAVPLNRAVLAAMAAPAATAAVPAASAPPAWQHAASMPDPRGEVAAARVAGEIAVVGGFDRS